MPSSQFLRAEEGPLLEPCVPIVCLWDAEESSLEELSIWVQPGLTKCTLAPSSSFGLCF